MQPSRVMAIAAGGFLAVILILTFGIAVTIHHLDRVAERSIRVIQRNSREGTLAEKLRQQGMHATAAERGWLLARSPALLDHLHSVEADFDATLAAIRELPFEQRDLALVDEVERSSNDIRRRERELFASLPTATDHDVIQRFEASLVPAQVDLASLLDRLVQVQREENEEAYRAADQARRHATRDLTGVVGTVLLASVAIGWAITRQLDHISQRERRALALAREAAAARDEVTAIVAHDLRNPLGAIVLKAELLAKDSRWSEPVRSQAASIAAIAMRTEYLVKALLEAGAIEERRFELTRTDTTVDELVTGTVQMFGEAAAAKSLTLAIHLPKRRILLHVDREHLVQALAILVRNAIRFAPPESTIAIAAEAAPDHVKLSVADRGPGIAREQLPHMFERVHAAGSRTKNGAGLGLFVAKGIVDAHGGRMWAESEPGGGAKFNITLPLEPAPSA